MGTTGLLLTAVAAVAVLLVLVIKIELPAFVAMLLVAMGTALVTGYSSRGRCTGAGQGHGERAWICGDRGGTGLHARQAH